MSPVVTRRSRFGGNWGRSVASYAAGTHWPVPELVDGRWRCNACLRPLRRYHDRKGVERLRHHRRAA